MSDSYPKIKTLWKRDPATGHDTVLEGEYSKPEFEYLADCHWQWTEKVDGMNIRVDYNPAAGVKFAGKSDNAVLPDPLQDALEALFGSDQLVSVFPNELTVFTLYGEGYGGKIRKGSRYRIDQSFVLFDVRVDERWLPWSEVERIGQQLGIGPVPWLGAGNLRELSEYVHSGPVSAWTGEGGEGSEFPMEGVVARASVELVNCWGERVITKLKGLDFSRT